MEIVKKYLAWFILAAIVLVLVVVQFLIVGGRRAEAATAHKEVVDQLDRFTQFARMASSKIPTQGDLDTSDEKLKLIQDEGREVSRRWLKYTCGLNSFINAEGEVLNPENNETVRQEIFAQFINDQYLALFADVEKKMAAMMQPHWEEMLADGFYARDPLMKNREDARPQAKTEAEKMTRAYAQIFSPADLIPVSEDEQFSYKNPGKIWQVWRSFLITRDILERVVSGLVVEMPRQVPMEERREGGDDDLAASKKALTKMAPYDCKAWRCIENIEILEVSDPELGNSELAALSTAAGEAGEAGKKAEPAAGAAGIPGEETRYHDTFTVRITFVAHAKVVEQFMRKVLQSEDIFYVPISMSVTSFDDQQTMGNYQLQNPTIVGTPGKHGYRSRPSIPLFTISGFEHESPVQANLVYRVYRFRYADTKNQKAQIAATGMGF